MVHLVIRHFHAGDRRREMRAFVAGGYKPLLKLTDRHIGYAVALCPLRVVETRDEVAGVSVQTFFQEMVLPIGHSYDGHSFVGPDRVPTQ